ncbi:hypothetical protein [Metabacillus elymi]
MLGIECDGVMYHSSRSAKERDVYRQKFVETKVWKSNFCMIGNFFLR